MADIAEHLERAETVIAVVGATDTPWKYGGKIYRDLKSKGFQVRPINPNRDSVDGDPTFPDLASVRPDDVVSFELRPAGAIMFAPPFRYQWPTEGTWG